MIEHAQKTYLHEFMDDATYVLLASFNSTANEENATALPIRAAVANIPIDGIHSEGGKNSCIALIEAGQHALKIKSTNIHEDAKD